MLPKYSHVCKVVWIGERKEKDVDEDILENG